MPRKVTCSEDFANVPALQGGVAQQAEDLRKLHTQEYRLIRAGKDLDKFAKDKDPSVRAMVAKYGGLTYCYKLHKDPDDSVRIEVAKNADKNLANLMTSDTNATVKKYAMMALQRVV